MVTVSKRLTDADAVQFSSAITKYAIGERNASSSKLKDSFLQVDYTSMFLQKSRQL